MQIEFHNRAGRHRGGRRWRRSSSSQVEEVGVRTAAEAVKSSGTKKQEEQGRTAREEIIDDKERRVKGSYWFFFNVVFWQESFDLYHAKKVWEERSEQQWLSSHGAEVFFEGVKKPLFWVVSWGKESSLGRVFCNRRRISALFLYLFVIFCEEILKEKSKEDQAEQIAARSNVGGIQYFSCWIF